jgi:CubicO group peptidase (beta-lactamase class C family)
MSPLKKSFIFKTILFLIFFFFSSTILFGQNNRKAKAILKNEVDSILRSKVDLDEIPGAVIEIKKGKKVIFKHAYGYSQKYDYNHTVLTSGTKMNVRHIFDIASLTKVVGTTTSVMLLIDRDSLGIDDPVYKYINAFDTAGKREVTIRHLLTHTAGLNEWYPLYYRATNKNDCYRLIGDLPLKFPVGQERHYSDLGFVLLGEIIEIISGLPLDQFMKENIFQPLHMTSTTFNPLTTGNFKNIAATSHGNPYEKRMVYDSTLGFKYNEIDPENWDGWRTYTLKGEVNDGNTWYANGGISGAAGLFSPVADLQKLTDMLVNNGKTGSNQFLSEKTIKAFLSKDVFSNGLGWMMDPGNSFMKDGPEGTFGHTGFTGTSIVAIPADKLSVIILINRQNTGLMANGEYYNVTPVRRQIFEAVLKYRDNRVTRNY